jgi:hypothetical protein
LTTPAEAHCYRIWNYPKPQRCFTALAPRILPRFVNQPVLPPERIAIPLPTLEWIECPPGDERMWGIAKLRALQLN